MSKLEIEIKLMHISSIIFNIVIQNIIATYGELDIRVEENNYLENFEAKQRSVYKKIIDEWIKNTEIDKKIQEYILLEKDEYGLDYKNINYINEINDCFFELEREMIINSLEIKNKWKEKVFGDCLKEIESLKLELSDKIQKNEELVELLKINESELKKLNKDNEQLEKDKEKLRIQVKESNDKQRVAEQNCNKLRLEKDKLNDLLSSKENDIETLSNKNKELEESIESLKINIANNEGAKKGDLEKKIIYYENLLEKAKEINIKKDKEINKNREQISIKEKEIEDIKIQFNFKEQQVYELKEKLIEKDKLISNLMKDLKQKDFIIEEEKSKVKIDINEFKNQYKSIEMKIGVIIPSIFKDVRIIDGESSSNLCSGPHKLNRELTRVKDIEKALELLDSLIKELGLLHKKLLKDKLDYNLEEILNELVDIKEKIN